MGRGEDVVAVVMGDEHQHKPDGLQGNLTLQTLLRLRTKCCMETTISILFAIDLLRRQLLRRVLCVKLAVAMACQSCSAPHRGPPRSSTREHVGRATAISGLEGKA